MTDAVVVLLRDDPAVAVAPLRALLTAAEQDELAGYSHPARRRSFVFSRRLLRLVLAPRLQLPEDRIRFRRAGNGRLVLADDSPWQFSLSHAASGDIAVIVAKAACGIDVEALRPVAAGRIARRYFSPAETRWLERLPEAARQHAFFRLWTLKEAAAKALGQGLAGNLARLAFDVSGAAPRWRAEAPDLALFQHDGDGLVLGAAVAAAETVWQRHDMTAAELCGAPPRPA